MNLTTARTFIRQHARNAGDSSLYSDADLDRALQTVADDFIRFTHCTKQTSTVTLTSGTSTFTIGSTIVAAGFLPERTIRAWISDTANLALVDHSDIVQRQIDDPTTAIPLLIGFETPSTGEVYPTPNDAYTIKIQWWPPFTVWTPGGSDPGTLNLPDDYLRTMLIYGATSLLQHNEPEHAYASESWKKYLAFRQEILGVGTLGAKVHIRRPLAL